MNPLAEVLKSQEERERLQKIEQLRRKGEKFIRVRYIGQTIPQIDSEGLCYNIRIHGLEDVEAYESTDFNSGRTEWKARKGAKVLALHQTASGDIEGDIWVDPRGRNKRFIWTHRKEFEVLDSKIWEEIEEEAKKPFNPEPSRKEELELEIADKVRELDQLNQQEAEKKQSKKKGRPKREDGINESTSGVDSSGVSRVAAGGNAKGDTSSI
ncbi:MAG: hypothetical protein ACWGNI_00130 [Desulfobacterales bacterium]